MSTLTVIISFTHKKEENYRPLFLMNTDAAGCDNMDGLFPWALNIVSSHFYVEYINTKLIETKLISIARGRGHG